MIFFWMCFAFIYFNKILSKIQETEIKKKKTELETETMSVVCKGKTSLLNKES